MTVDPTSPPDPQVSNTTNVVNVSFVDRFTNGLRQNALLYVVLIVLVMTIAAFWVAITGVSQNRDQNIRLSAQVQCQNRYNTINNERTRQLSTATDAERIAENTSDEALAAFVRGVEQNLPEAQLEVLLKTLSTALTEQKQKREATEIERNQHPVPPPPQALCGPVAPADNP